MSCDAPSGEIENKRLIYQVHREELRTLRTSIPSTMAWFAVVMGAVSVAESQFLMQWSPGSSGISSSRAVWASPVFGLASVSLWLTGLLSIGNLAWQYGKVARVVSRLHADRDLCGWLPQALGPESESADMLRDWGRWTDGFGDRTFFSPKTFGVCWSKAPEYFSVLTIWSLLIFVGAFLLAWPDTTDARSSVPVFVMGILLGVAAAFAVWGVRSRPQRSGQRVQNAKGHRSPGRQ